MYTDPSFRMTVEDVFTIRNRGTVVTGQIEIGEIRVGNEVYIHGANPTKTAVISSIEMFRREQPQAQAGDKVGLILADITKEDVQRGDILSGTII
jgi:elongation factor Tu